jgi:hypothetical protein
MTTAADLYRIKNSTTIMPGTLLLIVSAAQQLVLAAKQNG